MPQRWGARVARVHAALRPPRSRCCRGFAAAAAASSSPGVDPTPLAGSVSLVTGGGRGIGAAISLALAQRGSRVAIVYNSDADSAAATLAALPGDGHTACQADVSDPAAVEALVASVAEEMGGPIDILVNNAGIDIRHDILDDSLTYAEWQRAWADVLNANLQGPANLSFCAARQMLAHGVSGRIINVSSRGAYRGEPTAPAYGASKAGLNQLTQSLAKALGTRGIVVAGVAPGFVDTEVRIPFIPARRAAPHRCSHTSNRPRQPRPLPVAPASHPTGPHTHHPPPARVLAPGWQSV